MAANTPRDPALNGHRRRMACADVRATQPTCHLCGEWVDLTLDRQWHPLASCIDELLPRSLGGSATDPTNLGHAHRCCNGSRHNTWPITPEVRQRCRTLALSHLGTVEHAW